MTTTGVAVHDQNLEKQMEKHMGGCMAGFFNLFDRNHLLSGKRLYPKRLPAPSPVYDSASEPVSSPRSPAAVSTEFEKPKQQQLPEVRPSAPEKDTPPVTPPPKSSSSSPSPWKFSREAPRLSLDSRAITDGKGGLRPREIRINTGNTVDDDDERDNQRRSPSVIARLMGLEPLLPSADGGSESELEKKVELRRSASESRSRDYRFYDGAPSFLSPVCGNKSENGGGERKLDRSVVNRQQQQQNIKINCQNHNMKMRNHQTNNNNNNHNKQQRRLMVERRSFYDTTDFFPPEAPTKQQYHQTVSIYGEIERRLRMRGIDEPSKDLETLKHILEALQLKGLLHSSSSSASASAAAVTTAAAKPMTKNVVYDRRYFSTTEEESPIVVMRPGRPTSPTAANRRRNYNASSAGEPSVSPRRERPTRSSSRGENRSSSPIVRRKGGGSLSVETTTGGLRNTHSPVQSPRMGRRSDQTVSRSPRSRRSTVEINNNQGDRVVQCGPTFAEDEVSTVSECSFSTSSHTDNERWRVDEYRDGRNILERCDKLLHSIAEMNSNSTELQQPSPVSVLDSSFYKEDESSPSPVKKRIIDFKDQAVIELEDELWSPSSSTQLLKLDNDVDSSDGSEFSYVSEVLQASNYLPDDKNLFLLLEKQSLINGVGRDRSKASTLQRKLIFDTINEILDRNRQLPPWKAASSPGKRPMSEQIWSEFQKIRERGPSEDLFEVICGVLKKDLAGDSVNGWADCPTEMSEAVLDIERLIFKDLVGETIRDLAVLAGQNVGAQALRRKLDF